MKLDFSVAVHSLLYLDANRYNKVSSRELAASLQLNSVIIRNILSVLHKKQYISSTVGKNGGYQLKKQLTEINLGELYDLTIPPTMSYARFITGDTQDASEPADLISSNIEPSLTELFTLADSQYRAFYHRFTMADLAQDLKDHETFKQLTIKREGAN